MAKGRCVCGETGDERAIRVHVLQCAKWAAAFRRDPTGTLEPAPEYDRWLEQDRPAEKAASLDRVIADTDARRQGSLQRFRPRDPLEDE